MGQLVSDSTLDSNSHWLKSSLANFNFQVYKAKEDSECCTRYFCDAGRWFELYLTTVHVNIAYIRCFDMNITDLMGQEVIHLNRPLRCQSCCFPCCLQVRPDNTIYNKHTKLFFSPGDGGVQSSRYCYWNHRATVEHYSSKVSYLTFNIKTDLLWTLLLWVSFISIIKEAFFRLLIKDELGTPVFRIEGPCWTGSCMGSDVEFNVLSVESEEEVFISIFWLRQGAQWVSLCVCLSGTSLSRALNLHLSLIGQSQVSPRSVPGLSSLIGQS